MEEIEYINNEIKIIKSSLYKNSIEFRDKKTFSLLASYCIDTNRIETSSIYGIKIEDLKSILKYIETEAKKMKILKIINKVLKLIYKICKVLLISLLILIIVGEPVHLTISIFFFKLVCLIILYVTIMKEGEN